jgi:hypothetical protein
LTGLKQLGRFSFNLILNDEIEKNSIPLFSNFFSSSSFHRGPA